MESLTFEELFGDEMMISSPVVWSDEMQQLSSEYSATDYGVFPTHFNLSGVGCHQSFDGFKKVNAFDLSPSCESSSLVLPASTGSVSDSGDSTETTTAYLNRFHEVSRFLDEDDDELPTATTHQFQSFKDYTHGGGELLQFPTTHNDELEGGILAILSHCKSTDSTSSSVISGGSTESYPNIPFHSSKERRTTLTSTGTSPKRKQIGPFDVKSEAALPQNKKPRRPSKMDFETQDAITYEPNKEAITQMKEMIYRAAVMRPVNLGPEKPTEKPKRKNVRISNDAQTVAARHRRERIGDRLRVLQKLVPGGNKMDTASMLDEACNYLKYLKSQLGSMDNLKRRVDFNPNFSFLSKYA